jgi:hypothetical protein
LVALNPKDVLVNIHLKEGGIVVVDVDFLVVEEMVLPAVWDAVASTVLGKWAGGEHGAAVTRKIKKVGDRRAPGRGLAPPVQRQRSQRN